MKLEELYQTFDACPLCVKEHNKLQHILGVGKTKNPNWMFVLINPTYRNISSAPNYKGPRFPFIGVKDFWNVLYRAQLISEDLIERINNKDWGDTTKEKVRSEFMKKSIYLTNLVKCSANHSDYPSRERIDEQLKLFKKELRIVNPKKIVSFGLLPFEELTGVKIKLKDYWKNTNLQSFSVTVSDKTYPIIPCYFPVGRGNPQKAVEILTKIFQK
ncbi:MAG: hypothetical protein A3H06_02135 [Candidatus Colwellbacteria bacterium RIFCSPLOWO2_12_FULL_44_13]|uniref:Uracil-DNA glycosylase-like domain-containing protein n=3 Tax=Candidatus Colwelliibacteriota TaxID=1817904 RepID=A0A1G1Z5P7_9BACT|nr:MAG: hypothetical protein A3F24_01865 [Candidatus Colwellbacteria bacterium RIFCSPHIGHO2_12_FULL_44_17]OGY59356.1 MAG: hypothetical protein A3I31_01840 [Candidatus Colwellbacteria bacterium RIFCSPLOWO2_02_FULL_44_20b]OGY61225.1 MAG: hypothetical protein A3H06_02135 [Candidatus Colwellbacteria bacterium RIFCSPLOWO2_12_FULL_44_13]